MSARERLESARLLFVTDRNRSRYPIVEVIERALEGGVQGVILRERDLEDGAYLDLAIHVVALARPHGALVLLTNRPHLVEAAGADGAHLGYGGPPVTYAREKVGTERLVGHSIHTIDEAAAERVEGFDYLVAAPVYPTVSKPGREPLGVEALEAIVRRSPVPVFALGGVRAEHVEACRAAGAHGVAVVGAISEALDPRAAAAELAARTAAESSSPR